MIKRVLFNKSHLDIIELQDEYKPLLGLDGIRFVLDRLPLPGADAITLMVDGRIVCCFGFITLLPGVAEVWLFPSIYMKEHPVSLISEVNGYLLSTAKVLNWHRVQTLTQDKEQHRKWMRVLGFIEEGVMKNYHEKKDYIMSARYFDWGVS